MVIVYAATVEEADTYARRHGLHDARCFGDPAAAMGGFRFTSLDVVYVLRSTPKTLIDSLQRDLARARTKPRVHVLAHE